MIVSGKLPMAAKTIATNNKGIPKPCNSPKPYTVYVSLPNHSHVIPKSNKQNQLLKMR